MSENPIIKLVDCPILADHMDRLVKGIKIEIGVTDRADILDRTTEISHLGIFNDASLSLSKRFKVPLEGLVEFHSNIELIALAYIGFYHAQFLKKEVLKLEDKIAKIQRLSTALQKELSAESDNINAAGKLLDWKTSSGKNIGRYLDDLNLELQDVQNLKDTLREIDVVKISEVGKAAPKSNAALNAWAAMMLIYWTRDLGRTIENPKDGINGRSHLLSLMISCMALIHPAFEHFAIDNALRKAQKS